MMNDLCIENYYFRSFFFLSVFLRCYCSSFHRCSPTRIHLLHLQLLSLRSWCFIFSLSYSLFNFCSSVRLFYIYRFHFSQFPSVKIEAEMNETVELCVCTFSSFCQTEIYTTIENRIWKAEQIIRLENNY